MLLEIQMKRNIEKDNETNTTKNLNKTFENYNTSFFKVKAIDLMF